MCITCRPVPSNIRPCVHSRAPTDSSSDSGSDISTLPDCTCNESWLVTPPPCFTKAGTSSEVMPASPLEDLLIEHPSMSVYVSRGQPPMQRDREGSTGSASEESTDGENQDAPRHTPACNPRHPRVTRLSGLQTQNIYWGNKSRSTLTYNRNACHKANMIRQLDVPAGRKRHQRQRVVQPTPRSFSKRC